MNITEVKFAENVENLKSLDAAGLVERIKIVEDHKGRRSNTCFKKVYTIPDVGAKFGELTVTGYVVGTEGGLKSYAVKCSCGRDEFTVLPNNLRRGKSKRCVMCGKKAITSSRKKYYGYSDILNDENHRQRLLGRIGAALTRCHNSNDRNYCNYGGRGIEVCEDWRNGTEGRRLFLAHLITLDGWDVPEMDMDRINTDGNYEPGNLRFVTRTTNALNKRKIPEMQSMIDFQNSYIEQLEERLADLESQLSWYNYSADSHGV